MDLFFKFKKCTTCKEFKSFSEFYKRKKHIDGLEYHCKSCDSLKYKNNKEKIKIKHSIYYQKNKERIKIRDKNNKEKLREKFKLYYQYNKERFKTKALLRKYNLTLDEFNLMLTEQKNKCCVCQNEFKKIYEAKIDHCHKKGKVRGILCNNCNIALGQAKDSVEILSKLIIYLKERG